MRLFSLIILIFFSNVNQRKFINHNFAYPGEWEIGDAASVNNGTLYLTNSSSNSFGYAILSSRLPPKNWSIESELMFPYQNSSASFFLRISKKFDVDFQSNSSNILSFDLAFKFLFQKSVLSILSIHNETSFDKGIKIFSCNLSSSPVHFNITSNLNHIYLNIIMGNKSTLIFDDMPIFSSDRSYLSIAAESIDSNSPFCITSISFSNNTLCTILKNTFQITKTNIVPHVPFTQTSYEHDFYDVLTLITGLTNSVNDSFFPYDKFNSYTVKQLIPFAQRWQRRAIQMEIKSEILRTSLKEALNESISSFNAFRSYVIYETSLFKDNFYSVQSELYFGVQNENGLFKDLNSLKKEVKTRCVSKLLLQIGIFEIVIIFLGLNILTFVLKWYNS